MPESEGLRWPDIDIDLTEMLEAVAELGSIMRESARFVASFTAGYQQSRRPGKPRRTERQWRRA